MAVFSGKVLALCGGVGGAKLALGLTRLLAPDQLAIVVNTGDDFEHLGLHISPDIDTVCYTLSGRSNKTLGWGLENESWRTMSTLEALGGETWFRLGDQDLATHLYRTEALRQGKKLSEITQHIASTIGIRHSILPMSDDPVSTCVVTDSGTLPFQHYFVREQCQPTVREIFFKGATEAKPNPALTHWLDDPALRAVIICPSNPFLSIDPMLQTGNLRQKLIESGKPVIVISPIIGGAAVKGPTAKIMEETGIPRTSQAIAAHYQDIVSHLVIDDSDQHQAAAIESSFEIKVSTTATLMQNDEDKTRLARFVLELLA